MKTIFKSPVFWVIALSVLPLYALLTPGLPVTHDGVDHVARIANFYQSLAEGNLIPRWAGNLNWGYGHPILMFLYPFPSYLASLFHFIGMSLVDSTKMVFAASWVLSALAMYVWLRSAFGKTAGVIGALLYVFAPYRFVDLYVRGAIGEHTAFVFPPLILYFLLRLARSSYGRERIKSSIGVAVSSALLILAHNAIALMFFPVIGLYMAYLFFFEAKRKWLYILSGVVALGGGLALSAFFWIPAFFEGKYTLRDIVTSGEAVTRFVPWTWFFYSPWNYGGGDMLTKSLGIVQWAGVIAAIAALWKTKSANERILLIGALGILLCSFFLMTPGSKPVWFAVTTLQKFQFPWRFLSVSVFAAAVIGGIAGGEVLRHMKKRAYVLVILCLLIVGATVQMWRPKAYIAHDQSFYSGIYMSTTDTGESSPIWSVRFMEHTPENPMSVVSGEANITVGKRSTTRRSYRISAASPSRIVENTLFFPQWRVYIDGVPTGIQFQDPDYRGLITFRITPGDHAVEVVFEDTKTRKLANGISLVSLVIIGTVMVGGILWAKRK